MLIVNACSMRQSLRTQCEPNKSQLESLPQATFTSLPAGPDASHSVQGLGIKGARDLRGVVDNENNL